MYWRALFNVGTLPAHDLVHFRCLLAYVLLLLHIWPNLTWLRFREGFMLGSLAIGVAPPYHRLLDGENTAPGRDG